MIIYHVVAFQWDSISITVNSLDAGMKHVQLSFTSALFVVVNSSTPFPSFAEVESTSAAEVDRHLQMGVQMLAKGQLHDALSHFHAAIGKWLSQLLSLFALFVLPIFLFLVLADIQKSFHLYFLRFILLVSFFFYPVVYILYFICFFYVL